MKRIAVAIVLLACSRHEDATLTSATVDASARNVREMAEQWNRALANRDETLVTQIYGERVSFFGVPLRHDEIVRVQMAAFNADPSFTQKIERVHAAGTHVDFTRRWTRFGNGKLAHAWLDGAQEGGRWVVTGVGDDASDARARRAASAERPFCEQLAERIALSTREGSALVIGPPGNVQTRVAATPPELPGYAVAFITDVKGRPTAVAWYDVFACKLREPGPNPDKSAGACVTPGGAAGAVTDALTGKVLTPDPNLLVEMSQCHD